MILSALTKRALKAALLEALKGTLGIVTPACLNAGCSRDFYYDTYRDDPDFRAEVDKIPDMKFDFVEGKLFEKIQAGDMAAISFALKSAAGRRRGYGEDKALPPPEESGRRLVMYSLRPRGSGPAAPDNPNNLPATT